MPTVPVLLAEVVATSAEVAATRSRTAKRDLLAALLRRLGPDEIVPTVGFLTGEPVQGRIGVGWRTLAAARDDGARPAALATLTVTEVDATLADLAGLRGPGSNAARRARVVGLLARATDDEATFLFRLLTGELRQGALAGVVTDAVAAAAGVPTAPVRRAAMLGGDLPLIARLAMVEGADGLGRVQLRPGRPVQPMLASTADDVAAAVGALGTAVVDWKLDGIRVQVHRTAGEVRAWTRNLNEITDRLPEVCDLVAGWPGGDLVLDGEALVVDSDLRPVPFQDTASRVGGDDPDRVRAGGQGVRPWFFDLLHRDGVDLIDAPLTERRAALRDLAGSWCIPGEATDDPDVAAAVLAAALDAGHEGVVVKDAVSPYAAGRRGKAWLKVKPVHTLDLVVVAAEWGHGRRTGWLSNLHLAARDPDPDADGFVMVGKTFKGLSDELLTWQTGALGRIATGEAHPEGDHVVAVRPELVVEIAVDGVQRSTRYPGGVALRFARVIGYRPDKDPADADTIDDVRRLGRP